MTAPLKNPAQLGARLGLAVVRRLLLVDAPPELVRLVLSAHPAESEAPELAEADRLRSVKTTFDGILLWREDRVGSQSVLETLARKLEPGGRLWVVTAMRKVTGPRTPAIHRLGLADLTRVLEKAGLIHDLEARVSSWHVGYRFVRP